MHLQVRRPLHFDYFRAQAHLQSDYFRSGSVVPQYINTALVQVPSCYSCVALTVCGYACRLIQTLREYPNTQDFLYLRRIDRNPSEYNPYALQVVPFAEADPKDFFTLSAHGVTFYFNAIDSDFTSLDQWERELQMFKALKQLRLWRLFRVWKVRLTAVPDGCCVLSVGVGTPAAVWP